MKTPPNTIRNQQQYNFGEWESIKHVIKSAASEALGKRCKNYRKRGLKIWNNEIKGIVYEKKEAYLRYMSSKLDEHRIIYKRNAQLFEDKSEKLNGKAETGMFLK